MEQLSIIVLRTVLLHKAISSWIWMHLDHQIATFLSQFPHLASILEQQSFNDLKTYENDKRSVLIMLQQ
jgi:hypothetical protein